MDAGFVAKGFEKVFDSVSREWAGKRDRDAAHMKRLVSEAREALEMFAQGDDLTSEQALFAQARLRALYEGANGDWTGSSED